MESYQEITWSFHIRIDGRAILIILIAFTPITFPAYVSQILPIKGPKCRPSKFNSVVFPLALAPVKTVSFL